LFDKKRGRRAFVNLAAIAETATSNVVGIGFCEERCDHAYHTGAVGLGYCTWNVRSEQKNERDHY